MTQRHTARQGYLNLLKAIRDLDTATASKRKDG